VYQDQMEVIAIRKRLCSVEIFKCCILGVCTFLCCLMGVLGNFYGLLHVDTESSPQFQCKFYCFIIADI